MKDILKGILPYIGTALGGPLGGGVATFIADKIGVPADKVKDTLTAMVGNPEKIAEAKALELQTQTHLQELGYKTLTDLEEINASVVLEVNKTMQAETQSDHWPSYSWRPFIGFSFGLYLSSLWLLPLFKVTPVIMNPDMVLAVGGILGVASWFRGKAQADVANPIMKG